MVVFGIGNKANGKLKEFEEKINSVSENLIAFFGEEHREKCLNNLDNSYFLLCDQLDKKFIKNISDLPETEKKFEDFYNQNQNYRLVVRNLEKSKASAISEIEEILVPKYFGEEAAKMSWLIGGDWKDVFLKLNKPALLLDEDKENFAITFNFLLGQSRTFEEWTDDAEFIGSLYELVHETIKIYDEIINRYDELKIGIVREQFAGFREFEKFIKDNTTEPQVLEIIPYIVEYLLNNSVSAAFVCNIDALTPVKTCRQILVCSFDNFESVLEHESMHIVSTEVTASPIIGWAHSSGIHNYDSKRLNSNGESVNEILTEFLAKVCEANAKGEKFDLANFEGDSSYHAAFPLIWDYLYENIDYIKNFYINNELTEIKNLFGEKNYNELLHELDKIFKAHMNNEDVMYLLEIKKRLEDEGIVKPNVTLAYALAVAENISELKEVLNNFIYENNFQNLGEVVTCIDRIIEIDKNLKVAARAYRANKASQPSSEG